MITLYLDFITHVGTNGLNYILICISMDSNAGLHYKYLHNHSRWQNTPLSQVGDSICTANSPIVSKAETLWHTT